MWEDPDELCTQSQQRQHFSFDPERSPNIKKTLKRVEKRSCKTEWLPGHNSQAFYQGPMHGSSHSERMGKNIIEQLSERKMQCKSEQSNQMQIEFKVSLLNFTNLILLPSI